MTWDGTANKNAISKVNISDFKVMYLKPNSNWKADNARFAVYAFNSSSDYCWLNMSDPNKDGIYQCWVPTTYKKMIYVRMNPSSTTNGWTEDTQKWNQTSDLTIPTNGNNCYTVKDGTWDKGGGTWSKK